MVHYTTLGTQPFVLCREVVLFWRLFCIECIYKGTLDCPLLRSLSCPGSSAHSDTIGVLLDSCCFFLYFEVKTVSFCVAGMILVKRLSLGTRAMLSPIRLGTLMPMEEKCRKECESIKHNSIPN